MGFWKSFQACSRNQCYEQTAEHEREEDKISDTENDTERHIQYQDTHKHLHMYLLTKKKKMKTIILFYFHLMLVNLSLKYQAVLLSLEQLNNCPKPLDKKIKTSTEYSDGQWCEAQLGGRFQILNPLKYFPVTNAYVWMINIRQIQCSTLEQQEQGFFAVH